MIKMYPGDEHFYPWCVVLAKIKKSDNLRDASYIYKETGLKLASLVDVLCCRNALAVVLAVTEVCHQHLEELRLLVREFFNALQKIVVNYVSI